MEVFRSLALVGEPWAGHMSRQVVEINKRHVRLIGDVEKEMKQGGEHGRFWSNSLTSPGQDIRKLLDELCKLHVMLEELIAKYQPRLERSHVGYKHLLDLMGELREQPVEGFRRIGE